MEMKSPISKLRVGLAIFLALASGCATRPPNGFSKTGAVKLLPKLTSVITGPAGVLLTDDHAFSADFTMTFEGDDERASKVSGQILARGGKLRLEATFGKSNRRSMAAGDFGLIWDATARQGYVFSEALQGYAPLHELVWFTNVLTGAETSPAGQIEGRTVREANVTVTGSDGQLPGLQVFEAQDLGKVPLRINSLGGRQPFTVTLSNVRLDLPAEELFLLPDGFTKYDDEADMLDEMSFREQGIISARHRDNGVNINYKPPGAGQN